MGWAGAVMMLVSIGIQIYQIVKGPKGNKHDGSRMSDSKLTISTLGNPIPIGYGTVRMAGNIFWAGELKEVKNKESVGKGGGATVTTFAYYRSAAVALAHPAHLTPRLLKIFADGQLIYDATGTGLFQKKNLRINFYEGTETQDVDPIIEADIGTDNTPAYRGLCYVVFDNLPLGDYGNRLPNLNFVVTFAGTDDYTLSQSTQTIGDDNGWIYSRLYQRAYMIQNGSAAGDVDCYEWNLFTNAVRKVTTTLPDTTWAVVDQSNTAYDGLAADNFGNIYAAAKHGAPRVTALIKFDPISLFVIQTVDLLGDGSAGPWAILFYENPTWGPRGVPGIDRIADLPGNEFILCAFPNGQFQWVGIDGGTLELAGVRFLPVGGPEGAQKGALQMILTKEYDIIAIQGDEGRDFLTTRHLTKINPVSAAGGAISQGYDGTLDMVSMRRLVYDKATDGLIVFNDRADSSVDLPDGDGFIRYDISDWPPVLTAQRSEFVDGIHNPDYFQMKNEADNGRLVWYGQGDASDPNIYWVDSVTLDLVRGELLSDWGIGPLRKRIWDVDGNSLLAERANTLYRIFFDRSSGVGIDLDQIVADLCARVGITAAEIDVTDLTLGADSRNEVRGYAVTSRSSAAAALEQLMGAFFFDGVESDFILKFRRRAGTDVDTGVTIVESELGVDEGRPKANILKLQRAQPTEIPTQYEVRFVDPNADYQDAAAPAKRGSSPLQPALGGQKQAVDLPLVMTVSEGKQLAERLLFSAAVESVQVEISTFPKYLVLDPTDKITIETTGRSFEVRIDSCSIGANFDVQIKAIVTDAEIFASSSSIGQEQDGVPDQNLQPDVTARFYPIDSSLFRDTDDSAVGIPTYFAMLPNAQTGWRGGVVYGSSNNTEYLPLVTCPDGSTGGVAITELPNVARWTTWDRTSTLTVAIQFGALASSTEALVLEGANSALLGGEIISFVNATDNGDGTWDLDTFIRARRGTNWAVPLHHAGERFIVLDTTLRKVDTNLGALGAGLYYRGVSVGEPITHALVQTLLIQGKALRPYTGMAPVRVLKNGGNDAYLSWFSRTRTGGGNDWAEGIADNPTGETILEFEVDLIDANDSGVISATKHSSITKIKVGTGGAIRISVAPDTPSPGIAQYSHGVTDFSAVGFVAGDLVRCESFNEAVNRGSFEVSAVGTTTIDLFNAGAVSESAGNGMIIVRPPEAVLFTEAEQIAAGYSPGGALAVKIYQMSATVGRGFALEATI